MYVPEQGRGIEASLSGDRPRRLILLGALLDAGLDQRLDPLELDRSDHRAHVDRLVERRTHAQRYHAADQALAERLCDALLQQQPRSGATDLALVEPDRIDHAFHGAIDV